MTSGQSRILEREGYRVETAVDGADALEKLSRLSFDLVLLDVMMPGESGVQVIEAMHGDEGLKRIPVIMLSALNEQETVLKCIHLGAQDHLPKPIDQQLLKARITACIEKKRSHDLEMEYTRRVESMGPSSRWSTSGSVRPIRSRRGSWPPPPTT